MKRKESIIGLPVVCQKDAALIGRVKDIIIEPGTSHVAGFLVEKSGFMAKTIFVPFDEIEYLGDASILVPRKKYHKLPALYQKNNAADPKVKRLARLSDGTDVGLITSFCIDEKNGEIKSLEVSHSLVEDIRRGREIVMSFAAIEFSNDFIILASKIDQSK